MLDPNPAQRWRTNKQEENYMTIRSADAVWNGNLREGNGTMRMKTGAFEGPYTYASRFEQAAGTNPEELIGAAHAGCFSMALSGDLVKAGYKPEQVRTRADVYLEPVEGKSTITRIHLECDAVVPGIDQDTLLKIAEGTKKNCPISRALAAVSAITLNARLVNPG
jgi:lipoyl-dependent peroxiredoxin